MKIPRNLKPGDRLWYSDIRFATVGWQNSKDPSLYEPAFVDGRIWLWATLECGSWAAYTLDGTEVDGTTPPIIRVQRVTSAKSESTKKPKPDKDVTYLRRLATALQTQGANAFARRLRSIANRLSRGAK